MPDLKHLHSEIARFIRGQARPRGLGPLTMADVHASAEDCTRRIEALGFRWDSERLLWRHPTHRKEK
jgi:hypothetical protein